jgi:hypothetical protein
MDENNASASTTLLWDFTLKESADDSQRWPDLVCELCDKVVTQAEPEDSMGTLFSLMQDHEIGCTPNQKEN